MPEPTRPACCRQRTPSRDSRQSAPSCRSAAGHSSRRASCHGPCRARRWHLETGVGAHDLPGGGPSFCALHLPEAAARNSTPAGRSPDWQASRCGVRRCPTPKSHCRRHRSPTSNRCRLRLRCVRDRACIAVAARAAMLPAAMPPDPRYRSAPVRRTTPGATTRTLPTTAPATSTSAAMSPAAGQEPGDVANARTCPFSPAPRLQPGRSSGEGGSREASSASICLGSSANPTAVCGGLAGRLSGRCHAAACPRTSSPRSERSGSRRRRAACPGRSRRCRGACRCRGAG